jgi:hypothetical protein
MVKRCGFPMNYEELKKYYDEGYEPIHAQKKSTGIYHIFLVHSSIPFSNIHKILKENYNFHATGSIHKERDKYWFSGKVHKVQVVLLKKEPYYLSQGI